MRRDTRQRDIWTALGLFVLMGVYLYGTYQFSDRSPPGVPNARTFPFLILGTLAVLTIAMLWTSRQPEPEEPAGMPEDEADVRLVEDPSLARLGLLVAMLLAYLWVMPRIGFLASTVILGVVMQVVIFRANWLLSLVVSAVLAAGGYWLFSEMLSIPLP